MRWNVATTTAACSSPDSTGASTSAGAIAAAICYSSASARLVGMAHPTLHIQIAFSPLLAPVNVQKKHAEMEMYNASNYGQEGEDKLGRYGCRQARPAVCRRQVWRHAGLEGGGMTHAPMHMWQQPRYLVFCRLSAMGISE